MIDPLYKDPRKQTKEFNNYLDALDFALYLNWKKVTIISMSINVELVGESFNREFIITIRYEHATPLNLG